MVADEAPGASATSPGDEEDAEEPVCAASCDAASAGQPGSVAVTSGDSAGGPALVQPSLQGSQGTAPGPSPESSRKSAVADAQPQASTKAAAAEVPAPAHPVASADSGCGGILAAAANPEKVEEAVLDRVADKEYLDALETPEWDGEEQHPIGEEGRSGRPLLLSCESHVQATDAAPAVAALTPPGQPREEWQPETPPCSPPMLSRSMASALGTWQELDGSRPHSGLRFPMRRGGGHHEWGASATPCSASSGGQDQPLVIPADASLSEGLRMLLLHHVRRSLGSEVPVSVPPHHLSFLEDHVAWLASNSIAFLARFLGRLRSSENSEESASRRAHSSGDPRCDPVPPPKLEPRTRKKPLKLSDDEILNIYRSAQAEAAIEADWRGIHNQTSDSTGRAPSSSASSSGGVMACVAGQSSPVKLDKDREYLRMFSRALQEPGRSPRALTAEMLDPYQVGLAACCQPRTADGPPQQVGGDRSRLLRETARSSTSNSQRQD